MIDYKKAGMKLHKEFCGKISVQTKMKLKSKKDICTLCGAGAVEPTRQISVKREKAYEYTCKGNTIAVVSDGSHVLGMGNVGSLGSLPAIEGKCAIIAEFSKINAVPVALATQDPHKIVDTIKMISPSFGAIMLEDIEHPKNELILQRLSDELKIPVFHNDSQITGVTTLAAVLNALKVSKKKLNKAKVVIIGTGVAAGGITRLLMITGTKEIVVCDNRGPIFEKRPNMNESKNMLAKNLKLTKGKKTIEGAVEKADVLICCCNHKVDTSLIQQMAKDPIVILLSRPNPEMEPKAAKEAGAKVVATGMYEYDNHVDNALVYPGLLKSIIEHEIRNVSEKMLIEIAEKIANIISKPVEKEILPDIFNKKVNKVIDDVVAKYAPVRTKAKKVLKKIKKKFAKKAQPVKKTKPVKKVLKKSTKPKKVQRKKIAKKKKK